MVGLAGNTLLSSFENNRQKMSDSSGKEDASKEKTDKPLSNGTGGSKDNEDNKLQNESEENKMEVDVEEPKPELEPVAEPESKAVPDEEEDKGESNNDILARRKSRSSRSQSTNSSSSVPAASSKSTDRTQHKSKGAGTDEEDFYGFESPGAEISKEKIEKIGNCIASQENSVNNEADFAGFTSTEKYGSEKSPEGLDTAETDSNPGNATPSGSRKTPRANKKSINIDLSNPEFRKPFEYGWVRELVYRSTSDSSVRRNADIYYYTPSGKKVRSSREILEHLTGSLTIENFSFFKEPIGLDDPSKEIIREAKSKPGPRSVEDGTPLKVTPKVKVSQKVSPKESSKSSTTPKVVFRAIATPKSRTPSTTKAKLDKKRRSAGPDDVDVIMESSEWNSEQKNDTNGVKRPNDSPAAESSSPPEKKSKSDKEERLQPKETPVKASPHNFMMNLNAGFIALLHAFQYLKVYELLRAGCVSKMWQFVASHQSLWETVRMKNSRVSDWEGFGRTLSSHGTKSLDLRKMLVPEAPEEQAKMWEELCKAVKDVRTLIKVDMGRCSPAAFTAMSEAAPQLESLVSLAIKGNEIDLLPITKCKNLKELKLKAVSGGLEIKELSCLKDLKNLTTLALTTIKNLKGIEDYLPEGLVSLELGECSQLSNAVATEALPKLKNLRRLRLEKGQNDCPTVALLEAVSTLPQLRQLELINFDIKPGFDKVICKCTNLRTLLIIPTYVTQSATTNHVVMGGVAKLSHTLTYFIWGLTLELLKVTDLFIGQVENQKSVKQGGQAPPKKGAGDSIPILKPSADGEVKEGSQAPSQVDILALPNLQRVLSTLLPTTKIKILKVPFSATWRQTVTDGP